MKALKSILLSSLFILSSMFSLQASTVDGINPRTNNNLRSQVVKLIQNPNLLDHGITEAVIDIKFKIDDEGEIVLQELSSEYNYLIEFIKHKLHHQKIEITDQGKNQVYYLRINFEVK